MTQPHKISSKIVPQRLATVLNLLLKDEAIGGKLLLIATVVALIAVNSPLKNVFESFWQLNLSIGLGNFSISEDLKHWVNDGLMAIFFLVVALEIKREFARGELSNFKAASLPIAAAVGGMLVPAFIYVMLNLQTDFLKGWGIPIATDIAFAIGVLAVIGSRIPSSLKVFLLTLAIVDDLLAIVVIALFYTASIQVTPLLMALATIIALLISRKLWPKSLVPFALLGILLWVLVKESGVHATIAGALIGFLAPLNTDNRTSIAERLEKSLIPVSTFVVIPLFALANAGISFAGLTIDKAYIPVMLGIGVGLIAGKVLGILSVAWIMTKLKLARLPEGANWWHMTGVGLLAGIGFTVSIFITELAFSGYEPLIVVAKIAILVASVLAAILGAIVLLLNRAKTSVIK